MATHLIIPDSHATPGKHNKRFQWLGHLINDIKPDTVIDIGDMWDMSSLCSYDKGTKGFEGRRYKADIEAGLDANEKMFEIIRKQKKKLPRFIRTLGNHENRITRAIDRDPILEGTIGLNDLQSKEYGWEEYPFLTPVEVDGVTYQHYFTSGIMGRPIGGESHARSLILKQFSSVTQGHSHLFDYHIRSDVKGKKLHGCVVGVYQDYEADFAGPANKMWNAGVVVKRDVANGEYDLQHISLKALKKAYG